MGTESLTVCATFSGAGPKPTQGMPNIPAMDTALVLNVQRCSVGAVPSTSRWFLIAAWICRSPSSSHQVGKYFSVS